MFNFNLKQSAIFQAVKAEKSFRFIAALERFFLILFIFSFLIFLYSLLSPLIFSGNLPKSQFLSLKFLAGLSIIFFILTIDSKIENIFFNSRLRKPELKIDLEKAILNLKEYNLAEFLSFEVARDVFNSIKFAKSRKIPEINSTILLYFLLKDNPELNFVFSRALLSLKEIKKLLKNYLEKIPTPSKIIRMEVPNIRVYGKYFQKAVLEALKIAQKKGHKRIEVGDILTALSKYDLIFRKILIDSNLRSQDIENLTCWLEFLEYKSEERRRFWEWKNLIKRGTLAKEWAAGFTITLDRFSTDISEIVQSQGFPEIIGHQRELEGVERILARRKINNVLLIGEPGVGRKSIIRGLAIRSVLGQSLPEINYKRVVALDVPSILAQTNLQEAEAILDKIFREVITAGNIILVINDIHNLFRAEAQPGVMDISGILSPYLSLPEFQVVGITSYRGLHKYIEQKPAILNFFEKIEVSEISEVETLRFLERLVPIHEKKYKRFISYPALKEIISLAERYLPAVPFPKKAIGILDEVVVMVAESKDKVIKPEHIAKIVSKKTEIPVGRITAKEREILLNLENLIHKRIIDQNEAVKDVSEALRRARAGVTIRKGPMGAFLFLGPTGVGKTETSKAISQIYFGSEERMIRLDMSEFQAIKDIPRLIGQPNQEGLLTTQVRENPFSLILLDEFEKAHLNILNLFLQVLDEGFLTDGLGRKVNFRNSIIIATSNAGYKVILEALKQRTEWSKVKAKLLDYLFQKAIFRPELINRFDAIVVFRPLSQENLLDIAELMLQKLKKNLKEKGIEFEITLPLKEKLVEMGCSKTFGARQLRRVISDRVEDPLAEAILRKEIKRGDRVEVDPLGFRVIKK